MPLAALAWSIARCPQDLRLGLVPQAQMMCAGLLPSLACIATITVAALFWPG